MEVFGVLEEELGIRLNDDEISDVTTFEDLLVLLQTVCVPQKD
jgi:acyl carrier protein